MDYSTISETIAKNKFMRFFGWFSLVLGPLMLILSIGNFVSWEGQKANYTRELAMNENGALVYQNERDETIAVTKIRTIDDENIALNIPDEKTVVLYCEKTRPSECLTFNVNNNVGENYQFPMIGILSGIFFLGMAAFILIKPQRKDGSVSVMPLWLMSLSLSVVGGALLGWQIYDIVRYFGLKNEDYTVKATIYSEVYTINKNTNDVYRPLAKYMVDGKEYIWESDYYIGGALEENLGKTVKLYYDAADPKNAIRDGNPINILVLLAGIVMIVLFAPIVFFPGRAIRNQAKAVERAKTQKWKI